MLYTKVIKMNRFLLVCTSLFLSLSLHAQIGTGQWRLHVSPTQTVEVVASETKIYAAYPAGLLEYDVNASEKTLWTDVNGLSDVGLSALYYDKSQASLWIGYANGNIDRIKDNRVTNFPMVKLAAIQGEKQIFNITSKDNFVYFSTGLGIVKINPIKDEVVETFYPNLSSSPILETVFFGDSIYALSAKKLYRAYFNNPTLANPASWTVDNRLIDPGVKNYQDLLVFENKLFFTKIDEAYQSDSVYYLDNNNVQALTSATTDFEIRNLKSMNNQLYLVLNDALLIFNTSLTLDKVLFEYAFAAAMNLKSAVYFDERYYLADESYGLVFYQNQVLNKMLNEPGPPKNSFFTLGGNKSKTGVTSGTLTNSGFTYNINGAYVFEDEQWTLFDRDNQLKWQGKNVWDINSIAFNPVDNAEIAFGSHSFEPLAIVKNGTQIETTYNETNSPLEKSSLNNGNILVTDVEYDEEGNLWVLNGQCENILKAKTPDGVWYSFDLGSSTKNKFPNRMVIDYNGNKWFYVNSTGVVGFNHGASLSDPSDDQYLILNTGDNTGALPSIGVSAIAVDFDNEIWIGTDQGFSILYNSDNAFGANPGQYNTQRIKLDFEGNVEYLLGNTSITDIEVDGGNRKWMGTANTGIFLLSPDGLEIISHFTKENSPLISNNIMDLQFNHETGELFIITDLGLISYRSDASYEDASYESVKVFPNPARPEFDGLITIQGIKYDSDVKITDAAGNLVYRTTSNGGTAVWNGKTVEGKPVQTGVYLIWTASNNRDAKGRKVGKVLVVN